MGEEYSTADSEKEYVLVTEYFHPDTASTGQLMTDLATGLQERGLDMTVYTGQPNYHSGDNKRQPRISTYKNVLVKRIRAPQLRQSSLLRRLFNWAIFTLWMSTVLLFSRSSHDREIIFVSNPPFLPVFMWLVCRARGWDYTYIVYDLYPDQPVELGYLQRNGLVDRIWSFLNSRSFYGAKHIVALGPAMKERICVQTGPSIDDDKITIIHNWEDEEFIEPKQKSENWFSKEHNLVEPFTVLYSGNIGEFHDLETLIRAADELRDENIQFLIIGEGDNKEKIVHMAKERALHGETVKFLPYQPWDDLPYSLTSGDVSVVSVKKGFEGVCVSSKLYSSMATGQPVLGIVQPDDDEAQILDSFEAGLHAPQGDVDKVVEILETWLENPDLVVEQGQNARKAFETHFTKDKSVDDYYRLLTGNLAVDSNDSSL